MEVLTVRVTEDILEDIERIVLSENQASKTARFDPREVGRGAVIRHLLALGLEAYQQQKRGQRL